MKKLILHCLILITLAAALTSFIEPDLFAQKSRSKKASSTASRNTKTSSRVTPKSNLPRANQSASAAKRLAPTKASAPQVEKSADGLPTKDSKAKVKATSLTVTTNTKVGTIYLDGILAGDVGTPIETDAGVVEIVVKADGYQSQKASVRIRENESNQIALVLQKPAPKPTPAPVKQVPAGVASRSRPNGVGRSVPSAKNSGINLNKLPEPDIHDELFGKEDAFAPQPQFNAPPSGGVVPYSPYGAAPQAFPQQPYPYPYPMYPSQPYGYYPQPQYAPPAYSQYPVSPYAPAPQQPGALAPNDPFAVPPPSGTVNSRDVFTESAPSAGGVTANPLDQAPVPISEAPTELPQKGKRKSLQKSGSASAAFVSGGKAKTTVVKRSSVGKSNIFVCLMPLGIGQFYQGKILLGGAVALAQIGAIYYSVDSKAKAEAQVAKAQVVNNDATYTDAEKASYIDASNGYIKEQNAAKDMGYALFGAAWVIGATEAIVNPPRARKARSSYSLMLPDIDADTHLEENKNNLYASVAVEEVSSLEVDPVTLQLGVIAIDENRNGVISPVIGANLTLKW